jgi:ubiquinone/menaquinone biosynthesis C-methylase UbiE
MCGPSDIPLTFPYQNNVQLITGIQRVISKIFGRQPRPHLTSPDEIRTFKENAWKSKRMAKFYDQEVENRFFSVVTATLFADNIPNGASVLDVGAGTGRLSRALADRGFKVLACDISSQMLTHVNKNRSGKPIKTLECNASSIPLPDERFDAVVSMDLMVHFPDWASLLAEQARVCKRGGTILFNFLSRDNIESLKEDGTGTTMDFPYVTDFAPVANEAEIAATAEKLGLTVEALYPYNFFTGNALFFRKLAKPEVDSFVAEFNEQIRDDNVMSFVETFEEKIVRNLPTSSCVAMIVKLRKN